jgi:hypothetical protein
MVCVSDVPTGSVSDLTLQTGYWERLLCQKCETQFSRYEKYAAEHLLNLKFAIPKNVADRRIDLRGLDYLPLKLFLLSILWRVGVAKGDFFRCVTLGPHAFRLRTMLANEDPGEPDEYGCMIVPFLPEPENDQSQLLFQPFRTRIQGHNGCLVSFRGFAFCFFISRHALAPGLVSSFLNRNGELMMVRARIRDFQPLRELWTQSLDAIRREALADAQG